VAVVQGAAFGGALGPDQLLRHGDWCDDAQFCLSEVRIGLHRR
jgi:enoyl-CoA hydratase/carnithine racemase